MDCLLTAAEHVLPQVVDEAKLATLEASKGKLVVALTPAIPEPTGAGRGGGSIPSGLPAGSVRLLELGLAEFARSNGVGECAAWRGYEAGWGCKHPLLHETGADSTDMLYFDVLERHRRQQRAAAALTADCDTVATLVAVDAHDEALAVVCDMVGRCRVEVGIELF
eukprot:SAG22_NODE_546_length_9261_cov_18.423925_8_plen_166_part_00